MVSQLHIIIRFRCPDTTLFIGLVFCLLKKEQSKTFGNNILFSVRLTILRSSNGYNKWYHITHLVTEWPNSPSLGIRGRPSACRGVVTAERRRHKYQRQGEYYTSYKIDGRLTCKISSLVLCSKCQRTYVLCRIIC